MWYVLGLLTGILLTILFTRFFARSWTIGVLKVNLNDPEAELMKLNIDSDINHLPNHKFVILKVDTQK